MVRSAHLAAVASACARRRGRCDHGPVATRLPSLLDRAILFATHNGRFADVDQARDALVNALARGATGLQANAWLTADGDVVIDRTGLRRRLPRRRIRDATRAEVADRLRVADMLDVALAAQVRLAVEDPEAVEPVAALARDRGVADRLWLAHEDLETLAAWRDLAPDVRLVNATTVGALPFGPERRAAELAAARVDAIALPETDWTGGHVALFHRFDVLAFADGAEYERQLARVIDIGIDAVSADHADRMAAVAATFDDEPGVG